MFAPWLDDGERRRSRCPERLAAQQIAPLPRQRTTTGVAVGGRSIRPESDVAGRRDWDPLTGGRRRKFSACAWVRSSSRAPVIPQRHHGNRRGHRVGTRSAGTWRSSRSARGLHISLACLHERAHTRSATCRRRWSRIEAFQPSRSPSTPGTSRARGLHPGSQDADDPRHLDHLHQVPPRRHVEKLPSGVGALDSRLATSAREPKKKRRTKSPALGGSRIVDRCAARRFASAHGDGHRAGRPRIMSRPTVRSCGPWARARAARPGCSC
jgi:hypothetical protein